MKKLTSLACLIVFALCNGQNIPLHSWRSHLSYQQANHVILAGESTIFCSTKNGLYSVDIESKQIQKHTKESGFGDVTVSAIHYASEMKVLIVGYESGIVDLISSKGKIKSLYTLRDAQVVSNKKVHAITASGNSAYLATDFGVVFLDLSTQLIKENYRDIGPDGVDVSIQDLLVFNDSLHIISDYGLQSGWLKDNLLDFNSWKFYPELDGSFRELEAWNESIYIIRNDVELWEFFGTSWRNTGVSIPTSVRSLKASTELYALTANSIYKILPEVFQELTDPSMQDARNFVIYGNDFWIADKLNGLIQVSNGIVDRIVANGPLNDAPTNIRYEAGKMYAFFGPDPSSYNGTSDETGYSLFENGEWSNPILSDFYNLSDVAEVAGNRYFSSIGFGIYDETNSAILNEQTSDLTVSNSFGTVQISSLRTFGNVLYAGAYNSAKSLVSIENGTVKAFGSEDVSSIYPRTIAVSDEGVLWITRGSTEGGGLTVFNPLTGENRIIRTADGLPSSHVNGLTIDYSDEVWIATSNGTASYSDASFPFNDFGAVSPIFDNGFLFQEQSINDIQADGGDRIWFATDDGLWVFSRDFSELEHHFTEFNSPLLSTEIISLTYDQVTGEMFIQTDRGLTSYRSGSSVGSRVHEKNLSVFPNPVLPGYGGSVGISGLARNAILKITDSKGRLVRSISANGGTASWDLKNHQGGRVQAGIYLVFSSSEDGLETNVGKIAVVE